MPIRMLNYISAMLYDYATARGNVYSSHLIKVPSPKFYMLYNGETPLAEPMTLRLSDSFEIAQDSSMLELVVEAMDIGWRKESEAVLEKSLSLKGYSWLIDRIAQHLSAGHPRDLAISMAVSDCMEEGYLIDYLTKFREEVIRVLGQEYDAKAHMQALIEEGMEKGMEKGIAIKAMEAAAELLKNNVPVSIISSSLKMTEEAVLELKNNNQPLNV